MELVDTHCHLDFHQFDEDRDAVVSRAREAGVTRMVTIGTDLATSRAALALAEAHASIYATVGVHPNRITEVGTALDEALEELEALAAHPKVVAVGECGLDYYWDKTPPDVQAVWFKAQLELCTRLALPVVIHNREATHDTLPTLAAWRKEDPREKPGVLHSFFGTWEEAAKALDLGFYLGFTGPLTFKKATSNRENARKAPADRLLVETDAPYLTPHPHRGKRNEPAYVRYVAERMAGVRGTSLEEIAAQTTANAEALFGL